MSNFFLKSLKAPLRNLDQSVEMKLAFFRLHSNCKIPSDFLLISKMSSVLFMELVC